MKHTYSVSASIFAISLILAPAAVAQLQTSVLKAEPNSKTTSFFTLTNPEDAHILKAPMKAGGNAVTLHPVINNAADDNVTFVGAVTKENGKLAVYGAEDQGDGIEFSVPGGTYDFFAFGYSNDLYQTIIMIHENVEVTNGTEISFNTADATNSTALSFVSPYGTDLSLGNNCQVGSVFNMISYEGEQIFYGKATIGREAQRVVRSNFTDSKFEYTRLQFLGSTEGAFTMIIPVDFTNSDTGSSASNWQTTKRTFTDTPFNLRVHQVAEEMGMTYDEIAYNISMYTILYKGLPWGTEGLGLETAAYGANNVGIWQPVDYDGPFSFLMYPTGSAFGGPNSCMLAQPVCRGTERLEQLGVNHIGEGFMMNSADSEAIRSNPLYAAAPVDKPLGNCAPAIVMTPDGATVSIGCIGRYGEVISLDSWDMCENVDPEFMDMWGGQTNEITVKLNDKIISTDRHNFPDGINWNAGGTYTIDYSTDNVLIDGVFAGKTTARVTYDSDIYGGKIPSLTALSFIDAEGNMTDRLGEAEGSNIRLYASSMTFHSSNSSYPYLYYGYNTPAEIKVEYSPHGADDFKELPVEANPADDFEPGYGSSYIADLSGIKEKAPGGWFDLRVTVTGNNDACQVQTIQPAFNIAELAGLNSIATDISDAPAEYFNLQGVRITNPEPGQTVICRRGSKSEKLIVR